MEVSHISVIISSIIVWLSPDLRHSLLSWVCHQRHKACPTVHFEYICLHDEEMNAEILRKKKKKRSKSIYKL